MQVIAVNSTSTATVLGEKLVIPNGIPTELLTNNGLKFVLEILALVPFSPAIKRLATTSYNRQTKSWAKRFKRTIWKHHRHFPDASLTSLGSFIQGITYCYIAQVHRSREATQVSLVLACLPMVPTTAKPARMILNGRKELLHSQYVKSPFLHKIDILGKLLDTKSATAQACGKQDFDRIV